MGDVPAISVCQCRRRQLTPAAAARLPPATLRSRRREVSPPAEPAVQEITAPSDPENRRHLPPPPLPLLPPSSPTDRAASDDAVTTFLPGPASRAAVGCNSVRFVTQRCGMPVQWSLVVSLRICPDLFRLRSYGNMSSDGRWRIMHDVLVGATSSCGIIPDILPSHTYSARNTAFGSEGM